MPPVSPPSYVLVLGIGNRILGDEGVGGRVVDQLGAEGLPPGVEAVDGGTVGLALLPRIEEADAVIIVDAGRLPEPPGSIRCLEGPAMDAFVAGSPSTPHDIGLHDLMSALALQDALPAHRALVVIAPQNCTLSEALSDAVAAAVPEACSAVRRILDRWAGADPS